MIFAAMTGVNFTQYMLDILGENDKERLNKIAEIARMGLFVAARKFNVISKLLSEEGLENVWAGRRSLVCQQVFRFVLVEADAPRVKGTLTRLSNYRDAKVVYNHMCRRSRPSTRSRDRCNF